MFLWDMMVLSRSLNFFGIVEKDCPMVVATGLDSGMVLGNFLSSLLLVMASSS